MKIIYLCAPTSTFVSLKIKKLYRILTIRYSLESNCYSHRQTLISTWQYCQGVPLTHWGRVTHKCVGRLTSIGSDNGLSPGRRRAIIWTNAGILLIGPLGTNFSEILIAIEAFSFKKIHLKISSAKWRPFCLGLNVLSLCINRCACL